MSEKNKTPQEGLAIDALADYIEQALQIAKKSNKQARKQNRLAKRQYQQSVLNYEQAERQYLIEKSKMQPTFRLSATEFLMCEPDFMNDPEQASEAKYLSELGVEVDERVLRIKVKVSGDAEYMRPSIVIAKSGNQVDERAFSMTELICFVQVDQIDMPKGSNATLLYLVYRDKTTLPVVHKYQLAQQEKSALRRWDAVHIDTIYAPSNKNFSDLNNSTNCAMLFSEREEV